jgi:aspartate aminotransferase/aminotransferase
MISERMRRFDVSIIRKMFDLSKELKDPVNLSIGMPDFETPKEIRDALVAAAQGGANTYTATQGLPALRARIARKLEEENGIRVPPERIIVTAGVAGAVDLALRVLLDPGDEVIIPEPYFGMYRELVKIADATPVFVDTHPDFQLTAARIAPHITSRTKALIVNTPNNPTGAVYPEEELERIAQLAREHRIIIIADEIYEKFVYEGTHASIGAFYENTVTVNGLSKSAGITGWRIGYAAGPAEIIQQMCKLQQYTYICAPSIVQHAAIVAFDSDIHRFVEGYAQNLELVLRELSALYEIAPSQGALYMMIRAPQGGEDFVERMLRRNVLLVPGKAFSSRDTHVRLTYSVRRDILARGIALLQEEAKHGH